MEKDCIFCKIINNEINSNKIYEDNDFIIILDAFPISQGHSLVITKKHYKNMFETDDQILMKLILWTKKVGLALEKTTNCDGVFIRTNINEAGDQKVFHTHFHIVPKWYQKVEINHSQELIEKIKINL